MPIFTTADGDVRSGRIIGGSIALVALIVVLSSLSPVTTVGAGQRGVVSVFGQVKDSVLEPGIHLVNPLAQVHKISVQTETIAFDNGKNKGDESENSSLFAATKDLQDVQIATVVTYHLPETLVKAVYQQYQGEINFKTSKLSPTIREAVKTMSAQYTAEELVTKRAEFSDKVSTLISQRFGDLGASFETFKVVNFQFSDQFGRAIEAKATAVQNAETEKNNLEVVKFQAQQQIEKAKAQAETIRIQALAVNSQGGADYVQLQAISKWDGHLPGQMIPGGAVPFLNLHQ